MDEQDEPMTEEEIASEAEYERRCEAREVELRKEFAVKTVIFGRIRYSVLCDLSGNELLTCPDVLSLSELVYWYNDRIRMQEASRRSA